MTIDFCLPVRNEASLLRENTLKLRDFLLTNVSAFSWRIIVVINGSNDSSALVAAQLATENKDQIVFKVLELAGKGRALKAGLSHSQADILAFMDIDLAVSLDNLPDLLKPLLERRADLVIGSRLLPDSETNRSWLRELSSRLYIFLSRLILKHHLTDLQCGFKAIKREVYKNLEIYLKDDNWFFDTELVIYALRHGYQIKEIPVNWRENYYDERQSKINLLSDSWRFLKNLLALRHRLKKSSH